MSDAPYVFTDIDALLIEHLSDVLPEYHYGVELPADLDERLPFVFVSRLPGGPRSTHEIFDDAREDIETRAASREEAHDAMQRVLAELSVMYKTSFADTIVYRVDIETGPGWIPDPITRQPRWIATVSVRNRPKR